MWSSQVCGVRLAALKPYDTHLTSDLNVEADLNLHAPKCEQWGGNDLRGRASCDATCPLMCVAGEARNKQHA